MLNNKGPLMFINTVNTQIENSSDQKVYDSRDNLQKKIKTSVNNTVNYNTVKNTNISTKKDEAYEEADSFTSPKEDYPQDIPTRPKFIEERKIRNIIEMYHKDRPVLCNIISNDLEIIGIPFKLDDSVLYVKTSEDECENINLDEITDIIIIKF